MFDISGIKNLTILFLVIVAIASALQLLISLISIIYNMICFKTTLKEWLVLHKYFFLFYLCLCLIILLFTLMQFSFYVALALIPVLTIVIGIIIDITSKKRAVYYFEEPTAHYCKCGKNIVEVIGVRENSGDQKRLYFICRSCQKKYSKRQLENNGGGKQE